MEIRKTYHIDGTVISEAEFLDNKQHGWTKYYNLDGTQSEYFYVHGILSGLSKFFVEENILKILTTWDKNDWNGIKINIYY